MSAAVKRHKPSVLGVAKNLPPDPVDRVLDALEAWHRALHQPGGGYDAVSPAAATRAALREALRRVLP